MLSGCCLQPECKGQQGLQLITGTGRGFHGEAKQAAGGTAATGPGRGPGGEAGSGAFGVSGVRRAASGDRARPPGDMRPGPLPAGMAS